MRNLAFIELGPGGVQFFHEIANRLVSVNSHFYSLRPKSRSKLARLGRHCHPDHSNRSVGEMLSSELVNRMVNKKNLADFNDPARVNEFVSRTYYQLVELFDSRQVDAVFLWNGSGLVSQVAAYIARQRGMRTIFGEAGYFHNTMQLDPKGVNYAASFTATIANEFLKTRMEKDKLAALRSLIQQAEAGTLPPYQRPAQEVKASLLSKAATEIGKLRTSRLLKQRPGLGQVKKEPEKLPRRYVFIPLQKVTDSQLLIYSPLIENDMHGFVRMCRNALKSVAPDHSLVVKLHPAESDSVDYRALMKELPDVVWLARYPIKKVISGASLVITINSTVGVEALMVSKPVITLGNCSYNVDGVVQHVEREADLPEAIHKALSHPVDAERIERFVYHLYYNCFTHGNKRNYSEQSYAAVVERINQLLA